jgi:AcrR family transcriptional regulator
MPPSDRQPLGGPPRRYRQTRRADASRATRATVIAAARRLLVSDGVGAFNLERVAADAGVSRVTIYNQFGSRFGLFEAVAGDLSERGRAEATITAALAVADPRGSLTSLAGALCALWTTDPPLFRRLAGLEEIDAAAREVLGARHELRRGSVRAVVERLATAGLLIDHLSVDEVAATVEVLTGFGACDLMASRLGLGIGDLPRVLVRVIEGAVLA